jgi:hypothetical protein
MSSYFVSLLTFISSATLPSPAAACACLRSPPVPASGRRLPFLQPPPAPAEPSGSAPPPPSLPAPLPHLLCPHRRMLIQNATGKRGKSGRPAAHGRRWPERERMWEMRTAARVQRRARPHDPERRRGSLPLPASRPAKSCLAATRRDHCLLAVRNCEQSSAACWWRQRETPPRLGEADRGGHQVLSLQVEDEHRLGSEEIRRDLGSRKK